MAEPYVLHHTLNRPNGTVNCLSFSPTGEYLASGSEDGKVRVWDPRDGAYLHSIQLGSPILCLKWDPTRRTRIFCGCQDGTVAYFENFGQVHSFDVIF
jgi:WD40 repeat protein